MENLVDFVAAGDITSGEVAEQAGLSILFHA